MEEGVKLRMFKKEREEGREKGGKREMGREHFRRWKCVNTEGRKTQRRKEGMARMKEGDKNVSFQES